MEAVQTQIPRNTQTLWERLLHDQRDRAFFPLMAQIAFIQIPFAVVLFAMGEFSWWLAGAYWALWFFLIADRFILMLHCTSHRPLFKKPYTFFNHIIPWMLGPFCGETPESYFTHHIGHHHVEGNLKNDLSSTMKFERSSFKGWLRYLFRFLGAAGVELVWYYVKRKNYKMAKRFIVGELSFWTVVLALGYLISWQAAFVVFFVPVLLVRTLMMAGNWAQHSFVDREEPANSFKNSITCINTRYNRRCFNDGYHIVHHRKPRLHFTEMDVEFEKNRPLYGKNDSVVFDGLDFFQVWFLLMTKQWKTLAKHFVQLPEAPERNEEQVIALLKSRTAPIPV